jgi:hypothetical protein
MTEEKEGGGVTYPGLETGQKGVAAPTCTGRSWGWPKLSVRSADLLLKDEKEEVSPLQALRQTSRAWKPQPAQV